jgi:single-strand DNA-binding protein
LCKKFSIIKISGNMANKSYNHVVLVGNLGKDPEVRALPSGDKVASFTIATSTSYKGKDGQMKENTDWHKIEIWGGLADVAEKYLSKGKQVLIEGRVANDNYESNGVKHYGYKIRVNNLLMLGGKDSSGSGGDNYGQYNTGGKYEADNFDDKSNDSGDDIPF